MMMQETDRDDYEREHEMIFGHRPVPDLTGRKQCIHPMHSQMRAAMEAPGVDLEVPFDYHGMFSDDDDRVVSEWNRYDREVDFYRDEIKRVEAEERRRKSGKQVW